MVPSPGKVFSLNRKIFQRPRSIESYASLFGARSGKSLWFAGACIDAKFSKNNCLKSPTSCIVRRPKFTQIGILDPLHRRHNFV